MRTTPREKLVLWLNGLAFAICLELLVRSQVSPASLVGLALIGPTALLMVAITVGVLRRS